MYRVSPLERVLVLLCFAGHHPRILGQKRHDTKAWIENGVLNISSLLSDYNRMANDKRNG